MLGQASELLAFLSEAGKLTAEVARDRFQALWGVIVKLGKMLALFMGATVALTLVGRWTGLVWLEELSFLAFGALCLLIVTVTARLAGVLYRFGEKFGPTRTMFRSIADTTALFLLGVLFLYKLPRSFVVLALVISLILALRMASLRHGVRFSIRRVYALLIIGILALTAQAIILTWMPRTSALIASRIGGIDSRVTRLLRQEPVRIEYASLLELEELRWQDEGGPLIHYYSERPYPEWRDETDLPELWQGPTLHPTTGLDLPPVTESARQALFALQETVDQVRRAEDLMNQRREQEERRRREQEQQAQEEQAEQTRLSQEEARRLEAEEAEAERLRALQEAERRQEEVANERQRAAEIAASEQRRLDELDRRARYLNAGCGDGDARAVFAVVDDAVSLVYSEQIARSVQGRSDCFTSAFFRDNLFTQAFGGDLSVLRSLGTHEIAESVVLVTVTSTEQRVTPANREMVRVDVSAIARVFNSGSGYDSTAASASASGLGFSEAAAKEQALSRGLNDLIGRLSQLIPDRH